MFRCRPYDHSAGSKLPISLFLGEPFFCLIFALMGIHPPQVTCFMKGYALGIDNQDRRSIALSLDDDRIIPGGIHGLGDTPSCIRFRIETGLGGLCENAISG